MLFAFIKRKNKCMMAHGKNINVNLCRICLKGTTVMQFLFLLLKQILEILVTIGYYSYFHHSKQEIQVDL